MIEFRWKTSDASALVRGCEVDDVWHLVQQYFPPGVRVLESGCGLGRYVRFLTDRGWKVTGLEYVPETVRQVKELWPDLDVIQGDAAASPFADNQFDAVLSLGVVEHWPDGPAAPLRELFRVLKPGGVGIITVPLHNSVRKFKRRFWWNELVGIPRALARRILKGKRQPLLRLETGYLYPVYPAYGSFFEYRMTFEQFAAEVRQAGFEIMEQCPTALWDGLYHDLNPLKIVVRFKDWAFNPSWIGRSLRRVLTGHERDYAHMQAVVVKRGVE